MDPTPIIVIVPSTEPKEIHRSVTLSNQEWAIISQALEEFSGTFRATRSQTIATYVTRGQIIEAQNEALLMNELLQMLDRIQAKVL